MLAQERAAALDELLGAIVRGNTVEAVYGPLHDVKLVRRPEDLQSLCIPGGLRVRNEDVACALKDQRGGQVAVDDAIAQAEIFANVFESEWSEAR